MKYKVIGWTWYENYNIPFSNKTIGFAERHAIIDEIKKHKYLFSGWYHQESWDNCVPILNDGKKRGFSQRGWGGVMAEAYGYHGDYDYSRFTFRESINDSGIKCATKEFNANTFVSEPLEHEHFDIDISEGLFEIAKTKNPFYLEDVKELRFIDTDDTITLHCNGESLTFLVADINRSKKELDFKEHHLIDGKYKVIVSHKPMEKVITRMPIMILSDNANDLFKEAAKKYNFYTLLELFDTYDVDYLVKDSKSKKTCETIKRFVLEYTNYGFDESIILKLLNYLNDFEFYKEVSLKIIDKNINIYVHFLNKYYKEGVNIDEFLPLLIKKFKGNDSYILDLMLRYIEINPNKKGIRKRYYKTAKFSNFNGFILHMGNGDIKSIIKRDRKLIELEDFEKLDLPTIRHITELMGYPNNTINDEDYPFKVPSIYSTPYECIKEGVLKYQEYVNEHYDLSNRMEELLLLGIRKKCEEIDKYMYEEERSACYIKALEMLTDYKYQLIDKAIKMYPILEEYLKQ